MRLRRRHLDLHRRSSAVPEKGDHSTRPRRSAVERSSLMQPPTSWCPAGRLGGRRSPMHSGCGHLSAATRRAPGQVACPLPVAENSTTPSSPFDAARRPPPQRQVDFPRPVTPQITTARPSAQIRGGVERRSPPISPEQQGDRGRGQPVSIPSARRHSPRSTRAALCRISNEAGSTDEGAGIRSARRARGRSSLPVTYSTPRRFEEIPPAPDLRRADSPSTNSSCWASSPSATSR